MLAYSYGMARSTGIMVQTETGCAPCKHGDIGLMATKDMPAARTPMSQQTSLTV